MYFRVLLQFPRNSDTIPAQGIQGGSGVMHFYDLKHFRLQLEPDTGSDLDLLEDLDLLGPPMPETFTPKMLAARWCCSKEQVRRLIQTGEIPAFSVGSGRFRVTSAQVRRLENGMDVVVVSDAGEPKMAASAC
jgi:hypothetical protein